MREKTYSQFASREKNCVRAVATIELERTQRACWSRILSLAAVPADRTAAFATQAEIRQQQEGHHKSEITRISSGKKKWCRGRRGKESDSAVVKIPVVGSTT